VNHRIICRDPVQAHEVLTKSMWPWVKAMTMAGNVIVLRGEEYENELSDRQRGFLHGVVLMQISQQAAPNGQKFSMAVWKEHYRKEFLGSKRISFIDPLTGKKHRRLVRASTEDLGVRAYGKYIDRVLADAATEHGVTVTVRFDDYKPEDFH
jgi:hypothetical protein